MNLSELKQIAKEILAIKPEGEYEHIMFTTKSGGHIKIKVNLEPSDIIFRNEDFRYKTQYCGSAYEGTLVVEARRLEVTDIDGRPIYESKSGVLFIEKYVHGDATYFDSCYLKEPCMTVIEA